MVSFHSKKIELACTLYFGRFQPLKEYINKVIFNEEKKGRHTIETERYIQTDREPEKRGYIKVHRDGETHRKQKRKTQIQK
jgi:hypothetical protein